MKPVDEKDCKNCSVGYDSDECYTCWNNIPPEEETIDEAEEDNQS